jgi:hypothetical protein
MVLDGAGRNTGIAGLAPPGSNRFFHKNFTADRSDQGQSQTAEFHFSASGLDLQLLLF